MLICYYLESNYPRNRSFYRQPQDQMSRNLSSSPSQRSLRTSSQSLVSGSLQDIQESPPRSPSPAKVDLNNNEPIELDQDFIARATPVLIEPDQTKSRAESIDTLIELRQRQNEKFALRRELEDLQYECLNHRLQMSKPVDRDRIRAAIEARIQSRLAEVDNDDYFDNFTAFVPDVTRLSEPWNRKVACRGRGCGQTYPALKLPPKGYQGRGEMIYSPDYYQHVYTCPEYRVSGHMCYCLRCSIAFVHYKDFHAHQFEHCDDYFVLTTKSQTLKAQIIV